MIHPDHIEALSLTADSDRRPDYPAFRLHLDLLGYDSSDEVFVAAAIKAAYRERRNRRFLTGVLGRFTSLMMSNSMIGEALELPKSTIQAIASGRLPERFTAKQRAALIRIFQEHLAEVQGCLDDLV